MTDRLAELIGKIMLIILKVSLVFCLRLSRIQFFDSHDISLRSFDIYHMLTIGSVLEAALY